MPKMTEMGLATQFNTLVFKFANHGVFINLEHASYAICLLASVPDYKRHPVAEVLFLDEGRRSWKALHMPVSYACLTLFHDIRALRSMSEPAERLL